jgi:uncharacterized protein (DUF2062 family)
MTSFLLKLIACPGAVIISMMWFNSVEYASIWQPIIVGLVLAVAGVAMEYMLLKEGTLWTSVVADFAASVLIVYFISNWLPGATVTFWGAILTGLLLGVIEYFTHRFLISSGRTQKAPA